MLTHRERGSILMSLQASVGRLIDGQKQFGVGQLELRVGRRATGSARRTRNRAGDTGVYVKAIADRLLL